MLLWTGVYTFGWKIPVATGIPVTSWHAHEMLYGYTMAVIAGFLLTAVKNWTNIQTASGLRLFLLFSIWILARIAAISNLPVTFMFLLDSVFIFLLVLETGIPIVRTRQWRQTAILAKVILLGIGNLLFYAGVLGWLDNGIPWGIYSGLYLVIGLILTVGRRVN